MITIIYICLIPILFFLLNKVLIKKSFLLSFTGEKHQEFESKDKIPLSGGIILSLSYLVIFFDYSILFTIFFLLLFGIGILSDTKVTFSPNWRLFSQFLIILLFIFFQDLKIENTRILILDNVLKITFFNYIFVCFCLLILINGSNFIDGLNTSVVGYYLILSFFLLKTTFLEDLNIEKINWIYWIVCLILVYSYNFFKKIFLGDTGAYILAFVYGVFLIKFYVINKFISPFFIILILWYPCFEMLFSVIRKSRLKKSPILPDTEHLHQLIFYYLSKKIQINEKAINTLSASIINFYNLMIIYLSFKNLYNSNFQVSLITVSIIIYIFSYTVLLRYKTQYKN